MTSETSSPIKLVYDYGPESLFAVLCTDCLDLFQTNDVQVRKKKLISEKSKEDAYILNFSWDELGKPLFEGDCFCRRVPDRRKGTSQDG